MHRFTCGGGKIFKNIKKSKNIMKVIVDVQFEFIRMNTKFAVKCIALKHCTKKDCL